MTERAQIGGGRVEADSLPGWAKGFYTMRAHYFTKVDGLVVIEAACGALDTSEIIFAPGSFMLCKNCLRKHAAPAPTPEFMSEAEIRALSPVKAFP